MSRPYNKCEYSYSVGHKSKTRTGKEYEVIQILENKKGVIRFIDSGNVQIASLTPQGLSFARDYSCEKYYGVGFANGTVERPFSPSGDAFNRWKSILYRCYNISKDNHLYSAYKDVEVCNEWHNYYNFEEWYKNNVIPSQERYGLFAHEISIDKDLFSESGESLYSPSTCCILPTRINTALKRTKWVNGKSFGMTQRKFDTLSALIKEYQGMLPKRTESQLRRILNESRLSLSEPKAKTKTIRTARQKSAQKRQVVFSAKIKFGKNIYSVKSIDELKKIIHTIEQNNKQ